MELDELHVDQVGAGGEVPSSTGEHEGSGWLGVTGLGQVTDLEEQRRVEGIDLGPVQRGDDDVVVGPLDAQELEVRRRSHGREGSDRREEPGNRA